MEGKVQIRRVYDPPAANEGYRVLVDRLWPRGVSKQDLKFDVWAKELAPSPALRKWFGHKKENWTQFREQYQTELRAPEQKARLRELADAAEKRHLTLLYAAHDTKHNHALILAEELNGLY